MNQIEKNTVPSKNQLQDDRYVSFTNINGKGKRIMFVGNSMTLHGYKADIGWFGNWGMAASAREKDYVHLTMENVKSVDPDAAFCICQVSDWERDYTHGQDTYEKFAAARAFEADIIILRMVENCPGKGYQQQLFEDQVDGLVRDLDGGEKAKVIVTTGFWRHPADAALRGWAASHGAPLCDLGPLGELDEMKALGLFEHEGVAMHPGDKGMQAIADTIWTELKSMLE